MAGIGDGGDGGQTISIAASSSNASIVPDPTVNYTSPNATGSLTYTPVADANGTVTMTVTVTDDGSSPNSTVETFDVLVTAVNDAPSFTKGADQTVNEDAAAQNIAGWATAISRGPADESAQVLTFNVANDNNALFSAQPDVDEATGNLTYTPAANISGSTTVTISLSDDGGTANGGVDNSGDQTFSITVNSVNDAPSFTKGADQTVNEDAAAQNIAGWATAISRGPADESAQVLTFNVANDNNALFSAQPDVDEATGNLTYTPAANISGSTTVTISLSDDGGTANGGVDNSGDQTFSITVNSVNDAPSFTKGADQTVNEDAAAQNIAGWATAISRGPADESAQVLTFNVANDNNALFSAQPDVDEATGNLTYTPAANISGSTTVTISLSDDGGTANGGVDNSGDQTFLITVNSVNDAPSFTKGADQTVNEDAAAQNIAGWATAISRGPADESTQILTFNLTNDNNALFSAQPSVDAAGNLFYTPAADANGATTVTISLSDNGGTANGGVDISGDQTFSITVTAVNDEPSFTRGSDQMVLEDEATQSISGWATNIDPGSTNESAQNLTFNVSNDNNGLFSSQPAITATGTLNYALAPDANGFTVVTVNLSDDGGTANGGDDTSIDQIFTITVFSVNDEPNFVKGADQNTLEDSGLQTIPNWATSIDPGPSDESGQSVLFNVTNNNNPLFSVQPTVNASGTLTYSSALNANGNATVSVSLSDNGGIANGGDDTSPIQTFTITIPAVNDEPGFTKGPDQNILEDAGAQVIPWATNIDPGAPSETGQTLTFNVSNDNNGLFSAQPEIAANGNLTFTSASDANGSALVTVNLMDNGGTANGGDDSSPLQTFNIVVTPVNDEPSFSKGADQNILEDVAPQTVAGWATAISPGPSDESGQAVSFSVTNNNNGLFSVQPFIASNGTLSYSPLAELNGSATVSVSLTDDGGISNGGDNTSPIQTFQINITGVNDEPSFTEGTDQVVFEDASFQSVLNWATSISAGPANESSQTLSFTLSNDNNALFSSQPAVASNGTLTYNVAPDGNGTATVSVSVSDDGGTANGGDDTSPIQTFSVTVISVNDVPSFTKGSDLTVEEDVGAQTNVGWVTLISSGPSDESGQALTFNLSNDNNSLFGSQPAISSNGTLTYIPAAQANGVANVTVSLSDDGGTSNGGVDTSPGQSFTITVSAINDAPGFSLGGDPPTVDEDAGAQFINNFATAITSGPANESSQNLTFNINTVTNSGDLDFDTGPSISKFTGQLVYQTKLNTSGSATITVSISDDGSGVPPNQNTSSNQNFDITINPIQDAPSFTSTAPTFAVQGQLYTYNAVAIDPDIGETASLSVVDLIIPNWLILTDNGNGSATLTGIPTNSDLGPNGVLIQVLDINGDDELQFFNITVSNTNDAPTFTSTPVTSATEDALYTYNITSDDPDAGDSRTITENTLPLWLTLTDNGDGTAVLQGTPTNGDIGNHNVDIHVEDLAGDFDDQAFVIFVQNSNDPPSFTSSPILVGTEDSPYSYSVITTDPDAGDALTITALTLPTWLTLVDNGNGTADLTGNPDNSFVGDNNVVLNVEDLAGANINQNFVINVSNTNDPPFFSSTPVVAAVQNVQYSYAVVTSDPDLLDTRTITAPTLPGWLTLVDNTDGTATLSGTPGNMNAGSNNVVLRVRDATGEEEDQIFIIEVDNTNDPPSFASSPVIVGTEDLPYTYNITATDPDVGDNLTIIALSIPAWLTLTDNMNGTALLEGTPLNDDVGSSPVVLTVTDGAGSTDNQNFTVTVTNTNDAPAFTSTPITAGVQDILYIYSITTSDPDVGDTRSITAPTIPSWLNLVDNLDGTATLSGTPTNDDFGPNPVVLRVQDVPGAKVDQMFTINVDNANDPPSFTSTPVLPATEDLLYIYNTTSSDPDVGDNLTISALSTPPWLTLTDHLNGTATLSGTPLNDDVGSSPIVLTVTDAAGSTDNQNFTVTIANSNDVPAFTSSPITAGVQDVFYTYSVTTSDPDVGDTRTITAPTLPLWLGLVDNLDGTATLSGTPTNADFGPNNVVLRVRDAAGEEVDQIFTINVDNANDPPTFTSTPVTGATEDILYTYNITTSDPDVGDNLTITALSIPAWLTLTDNLNGTATLTGTPLNPDVGSNSVVLTVTDGAGSTDNQNFTVTVANANDAPAFSSSPITAGVQDVPYLYNVATSDPDVGDTRTITASTLPGWLTLTDNLDGTATLAGTPTNADFGPNDVVLNVQDAAGAAVDQIFTINVDNANDPPTFTSTPVTGATEDILYTYNVTATDPDVGDNLTIVALSIPNWLTLTDNLNGTATLTGTPLNPDVGSNSVVLTVTDGAGSTDNQNFTVTVANTNDAPAFTSSPITAAVQDVPYTYNISTSDPDVGDSRTIIATTLPGWLTLTDNLDGTATLSGTPTNADFGPNNVVLNVEDVAGAAVDQIFTINVDNVNDPPTFTSTPVIGATEDILYTYNITTTDPDVGDNLAITALSIPAWLTLTDNLNGTATLTGTPLNPDVGSNSVVLTVTDGAGSTDNQNFTVTVANANDAPAFSSSPITAAVQDVPYTYNVSTSDPDVGDSRTIIATTLP